MKDIIWKLRSGADRRFKTGHPWVYSNELSESPKGIEPGAAVELRDASGKFLARGYGNPASLISFRALTRNPEEIEPFSPASLTKRFQESAKLRHGLGLEKFSYRLCFAEADQFPGLIIDRYVLKADKPSQVFVIQAHTAGADKHLPEIVQALESLSGDVWVNTGVVIKRDAGMRKLEGLTTEEPRAEREIKGVDLTDCKIVIRGTNDKPIEFTVDLIKGQKTGFFLDQADNVRLTVAKFQPDFFGRKIKILDLCCYVGQWSTQLARRYRDAGIEVEVTAFDASAKALASTKKNVEAQGAEVITVQGDVLKDLTQFADKSFDLVISDPPALIKGRKDIPKGTHAYLQLNTEVFRIIKSGGVAVCCSCSSLMVEDEFLATLAKAAGRQSRRVSWVGRGAQAGDHPMLAEFPEGRYLKCFVGVCS